MSDSKVTRGTRIGEAALGKASASALGNVTKDGSSKRGGGQKMEQGSIRVAVKMLNAMKKGEPRCG